jgi:DNA-binding MarR family transcriptional regulator
VLCSINATQEFLDKQTTHDLPFALLCILMIGHLQYICLIRIICAFCIHSQGYSKVKEYHLHLMYPITSDLLSELAMWAKTLRKLLKKRGVTLLQYRILMTLFRHKGPMSSNALAVNLLISPGSLTAVLNKLESATLLVRKEDSNDRRRVEIVLLPSGKKLAQDTYNIVHAAEIRHFKPLGRFLKTMLNTKSDEVFSSKNRANPQLLAGTNEFSHYTDAVLATSDTVIQLLKTAGLSLTGFRVLFELYSHQKGINVNHLAYLLLLPMPDVTTATAKLVKKGLILRHRHNQDRRVRLLEINSAGFAVLVPLAQQVDSLLCSVVQESSAEQRELILKASAILADYRRSRRQQ